jgi:hypothetical protein
MQAFCAVTLAMHGVTLKGTSCITHINITVKSQPSNYVDARMVVPQCFYRPKSPGGGPLLAGAVVLLSAPSWLRKPALGRVVLYNGVHSIVFGNAVADALQDDLDPSIKGGQMGFPQHRCHWVFAHGISHGSTQLARSVVKPVDSNCKV